MQGPLGYDLMGRKNSAGKSCKSNLLNYTNVIIATQEKESFMIEEEKEVLVSCISAVCRAVGMSENLGDK